MDEYTIEIEGEGKAGSAATLSRAITRALEACHSCPGRNVRVIGGGRVMWDTREIAGNADLF